MRKFVRDRFFGFLEKVGRTEDGRSILNRSLRSQGPATVRWQDCDLDSLPAPREKYPELGSSDAAGESAATPTALRDDIVFVTSRFRSGSTLLWNLFRQVDGVTSYYEPFNERRWFDPAVRQGHTDESHRGVSDYWTEYNGLEELGQHFREDWIRYELYMDASSWAPEMQRYIELLVERAEGRAVLQFNRIDLRLEWIRHRFPNAKLVHLYRNPRDQFWSSLFDESIRDPKVSVETFLSRQGFYLGAWCRDLRYRFPFLDPTHAEHAYDLFYLIWRLSYLAGHRFAHHSLAYEDLMERPGEQIDELAKAIHLEGVERDKLLALVSKGRSGAWREYAEGAWFQEREEHCERLLESWFRRLS